MKFYFSILLIFCYLRSVVSSFCYWNSGCPYKYFGSKTPYNNVRGDIRDSIITLKGCKPISVWGVISNGKSYPESNPVQEALIIKNKAVSSYINGESSLCAQDIENLDEWIADKQMFNGSSKLTEEGYQELKGIGKRLKQTFPNLLNDLEKDSYVLRPANGILMKESAEYFIKGFENDRLVIENAKTDDDVMMPYTKCKTFENRLKYTHEEVRKYKTSSDYLAAKDRIQRRLGISTKISDETIQSIYDMCRFTWSGIQHKFSPWCALFTTEDLKVLEYVEDLKHYYNYGYGTPTNGQFGKITLADLLANFHLAKNGNGKNMVVYFADTPIMNMISVALKLFKDKIHPAGGSRDPQRKWRTSKLSVFTTNIFAVLNRCGDGHDSDHNIVFYWNEEPLLPICERGYCSWKEFEDKLSSFSNTTIDFCD